MGGAKRGGGGGPPPPPRFSCTVHQQELLYESLTALIKSPNPIVDTSRQALRHWFKQMVDRLTSLHELGFVHGNIKPQNIMLDVSVSPLLSWRYCAVIPVQSRPTPSRYRQAHFEIKFVGFRHCKRIDECMAIPDWCPADRDYAAPEYVHGLYPDKRSPIATDIWALGVSMLNYCKCESPMVVLGILLCCSLISLATPPLPYLQTATFPTFHMEDTVTEADINAAVAELLAREPLFKDAHLSGMSLYLLDVCVQSIVPSLLPTTRTLPQTSSPRCSPWIQANALPPSRRCAVDIRGWERFRRITASPLSTPSSAGHWTVRATSPTPSLESSWNQRRRPRKDVSVWVAQG